MVDPAVGEGGLQHLDRLLALGVRHPQRAGRWDGCRIRWS